MQRFKEKIALVTGASSGLGAATARRLAAEGAQVFGLGRNREGLSITARRVQEAGGTMATAVIDISEAAQCAQAVHDCVKQFGRLDALINVAGRHDFRHTSSVTEQQWLHDLAVNLNGPFFLSQAAIPHLLGAAFRLSITEKQWAETIGVRLLSTKRRCWENSSS